MAISSQLGELAQLVERCDRTAEVRDSSSLFSINVVRSQIKCRDLQIDKLQLAYASSICDRLQANPYPS